MTRAFALSTIVLSAGLLVPALGFANTQGGYGNSIPGNVAIPALIDDTPQPPVVVRPPSSPPPPPVIAVPEATPAPPETNSRNTDTERPDDSRYTFSRVQDGFLRLDSRTGHVSMCSRHTVGWACEAVPDERTALENEIARLQADNTALKKDMLAHGMPVPDAPAPPEPKVRRDDQYMKLPSDAELDRAMAFMDKIWRRLMDMVGGLQRDMKKN